MTAFPLMLDGAQLEALVVGGGAVALRKVVALLDAGAAVRVVAIRVSPELRAIAARVSRLSVTERPYAAADIGDALLVVAATDDRAVNAAVGADARERRRLVNVADAAHEGTCWTAATHRAGDLVVAVTASGVPSAAVRVRDLLAERLDIRYADAVQSLGELRRRVLAEQGASAWREALDALVGDDFCAAVECGLFAERVARWG